MDPVAELQHRHRELAHALAGLYSSLNTNALLAKRGDYGDLDPRLFKRLQQDPERLTQIAKKYELWG